MKLFRTISVALAVGGFSLAPAHAQVDTQYIGQISAFAANFCPRNWAPADGTLIAISQNSALFSLFGTYYGGNGTTTFALPDLRGRRPVGYGDGPGIGTYQMGQSSGTTQFTMTTNNLPSHNHVGMSRASNLPGDTANPNDNSLATTGAKRIYHNSAPNVNMDVGTVAISNTGGSQSVNKVSPYLVMRWCVAMFGIYPSRN
ncbi:MAG: microcystin-dependent protein [Parasphingorhabdus sp.]|jgi:microcystin-dependent protein|uniref:phage tail protein n=1 Tax=Parasphingorhabdus sp. TaxID=2709688 RepID=UPI001B7B1CA0|nr:tail fiber protein [Parasphingorhabdus sp.]MBQ0772505.1 tail fiber protein [Sphingomonadales bacterium]|tara:strand:+ start:5492 stop:6094 length:603 start_codon:yes stop_codon:yes gene_type:complete